MSELIILLIAAAVSPAFAVIAWKLSDVIQERVQRDIEQRDFQTWLDKNPIHESNQSTHVSIREDF